MRESSSGTIKASKHTGFDGWGTRPIISALLSLAVVLIVCLAFSLGRKNEKDG